MKETVSVRFYLRRARTSKKKGETPILARIKIGSLVKDDYVRQSVPEERWDQTKEKCSGRDALANQINAYLNDYRAKILEIRRELLIEGRAATPGEILNRIKHPQQVCKMILEEYHELCDHVQQRASAGLVTQITANKYSRLYRYLKLYHFKKFGTEDVSLFRLDNEYIEQLYLFLLNNTECHHNGAINILSCLRTFVIKCKKKKWLIDDPFESFKMKEEKPKEKAVLTPEEIQLMLSKRMPNERLEKVKDSFLFCCFTGLSFGDAYSLTKDFICKDEQKRTWVFKDRNKTGVRSNILLFDQSLAILKKYEKDPECLKMGKLLPLPSNQKMNGYLKEIAAICNINKDLSTHCARHTYATIADSADMSLDAISKVLGHAKKSMSLRYIHNRKTGVSPTEAAKFVNVFASEIHSVS